jgi:hypothetical protein
MLERKGPQPSALSPALPNLACFAAENTRPTSEEACPCLALRVGTGESGKVFGHGPCLGPQLSVSCAVRLSFPPGSLEMREDDEQGSRPKNWGWRLELGRSWAGFVDSVQQRVCISRATVTCRSLAFYDL